MIQSETYQHDIKAINSKKQTVSGRSLTSLDPFIDDQKILRVGGRLKYGKIPYAAKHQIILPAHHPAVKLLVMYLHKQAKHIGREHLLSLIRQEFWIVKARRLVTSVIKRCVMCQNINARPTNTKMADLPTERLAISSPPFYNTGVDYFGPITVKVLRSRAKRWGCIFTCLTTRAIHLEVAPSLETDDFLNVLERFISRRGCPKTIRSDCGTNFKGADNLLQEEMRSMNKGCIEDFSRRKNVEWIFNPPEAPHMGGSWERLVRSVKTTMKVLLTNQIVDDFVLLTLFSQAESIINGRPLTPMSDNIEDLEPLTPNHFLIGRPNPNLTPCVVYDNDVSHRRRWKQLQAFTNQFWDRWTKEYLPSQTTRSKWFIERDNIKVGELVLLLEKRSDRGKWPIGRVTNVFPSDDGLVRKIEVQTKHGSYIRPIVKVTRLEF